MASALVGSLAGAVPAVAAVAAEQLPAGQPTKSVPVREAGVQPLLPDPAEEKAVKGTPMVSWPAPGSATVELGTAGGTGTASALAAGGRVKAGKLPISVGAAAPAAGTARAAVAEEAPGRVKVDLVGRHADGLLLKVARADGVARAGRVSLEVDYSTFGNAYGGDWATRLRLVALPECATATPERAECRGTPVPTRNNGSGKLSGDVAVAVPGSGLAATGATSSGLFAVVAAAAGTAGNFGETSLSPSSTWQAGGPSGDFSWNYPMEIPPALNGPVPELALNYSSGSVDGRTTGTNNQPSWVGEGFELAPGGFIERRYTPCASDMKNGANNTTKTGDLCWGTDNLSFALNGQGGELIRDDSTTAEIWRPRNDDGSRVEHLKDTSLGNGDNNGEYWRITTRTGTQFYFGRNKLPGWASTQHAQTQSVWTVPVYGNHTGEECHASTFDASWCQQAWRWNLDYVVDTHGNTASYYYGREMNNYARNLTASKVSQYTRGGYLTKIQYGQRDGEVYTKPYVGQVTFTIADRCIPGTTCATTSPANWPDVPWDQSCTSTTSCTNKYTPTFWTQKRLSKVTTQVWNGTGPTEVDSWTLTQTYPDPGDGTKARLWLASIQHTGLTGTSTSLPAVNFDGVQMNNRVDGNDNIPPMNWWRMKAVRNESGGEIRVTYSPKECAYGTNLPAPDTNTKRCHPLRWTPEGLGERTDWFNKYVVTEVSESDRTTGFEPEISSVEYVSPPAWRHDDEDGLVPEDRKTWSQWRGYERLRVRKGKQGQPRSLTELVYFRGMDGDLTATAGVKKNVSIVDSTNTSWKDTDQFAGLARETITYTADGGTMLSRTITDPWLSPPTATRTRSWGTTSAYQVQQKKISQGETINGQWRETATAHTYDDSGTLLEAADLGNVADPDDDTCTKYTYARNQSVWLLDLPSQTRTSIGSCTRQPTGAGDIVSDERYYYDGSDTFGAAPVRGDVTRREEINGWANGAATYLTTMRAAYDVHGRLVEQTDVLGAKQTFGYTPATGAPTTKVVATNPLGQTTTTTLDPTRGTELTVTGPDGSRSVTQYDALGRVTNTWLPGRDTSLSPSATYQYVIRTDGPNVVIASTLESNGGYRTEYQLFDGKMRLRQTQTPSPAGGRVIKDVVYDSRGREVKVNGPYYNDAPPGDQPVIPQEDLLPAQTVTVFDDADRPTNEIFKVEGVEKWRTTHVHEIDRQHTTPPLGETPTTRILDAQGRLVELRQYKGTTTSGPYDATKYTYTNSGQTKSITDSAGNVWSYDYDARDRMIRSVDPDQGTTEYTYGDGNEILTEKDSRGVVLAYEYDALGRKTAIRQGSATGPKLAEWTYDKLADGTPAPGLLGTATRYVDGRAYTTAVKSVDGAGRVTKQTITIPGEEGRLGNTYEFGTAYYPDGEVASKTLPGVGGLPAETLTYGYNALGLPTTLTGATPYVTGTSYTEFGEQKQVNLSTGGKWLRRDFSYEFGTRRLSKAETRRETGPQLIASVGYEYDQAGNVTKITDAPDPASGSITDTQCFKHDSLRRLVEAWTPASGDCAAAPVAQQLGGPAPYWHAWTFDSVGNRKTETRTAPSGAATSSTYEYNAAGGAQPHALRKVTTTSSTGTKVDQYDYDSAGNTKSRVQAGVGQTLEWDAEGHLSKVTENGKVTSYVYDASGERLIRRDDTGSTLYLGDTELHLDTGGGLAAVRYYNHGGSTVAMRTGRDGRVTWLVSDHHGTAELGVDEGTQIIQRQRHDPYGSDRGTGTPKLAGDRGFVGGSKDDSTGLTHLGAREYDPNTGRFISVDPMIDFDDPQAMHGYAYANNSPVSFTDPDGRAYVTRMVTSYRTVYQTMIRKVVEIVRLIITMMVKLILAIFASFWVPRQIVVVKHIIRYIKYLVKRLVKVVKMIRVWVQTKSKKAKLRLANKINKELNSIKATAKAFQNYLAALEAAARLRDMVQRALMEALKDDRKGGSNPFKMGLGWLSKHNPIPLITRGQSWLIGGITENAVELTGGSCSTMEGIRVCKTRWPLYGGSGTTYGDTFVTDKNANPDSDMLKHEKVHRDKQWRRYGSLFGPMYLTELIRTGGNGCKNIYEIQAGLADGNYLPC
ncbi:RHS repeat-associated core domain-containing protein [Micromonospora sp. NPDC049559]|uniref:RHS repeat-associated core domain-containing protein n=1 Tax=Micromonospora sp. NPDC049559 TaxID=3155923 RepID=UPI0034433C2D